MLAFAQDIGGIRTVEEINPDGASRAGVRARGGRRLETEGGFVPPSANQLSWVRC